MARKKSLRNKAGIGCLLLFALPFAASGFYMAWRTATSVAEEAVMRSWVETPAMIRKVELKTHQGEDKISYQVVAEYEYEFGGKKYTSDRVYLGGGKDTFASFHEQKYAELERFRNQAKPVRCFVNPEQPSEAILFREVRGELLVFNTLFATLFGSAGVGLAAGVLIGNLRQPKAIENVDDDKPWLARSDWSTGEIQASSSAALAAGVLLVVGIYWGLVTLPLIVKLPTVLTSVESTWKWVALAFPTIGVVLLIALAYQVMRARRFGESVLQLATTPGVVGGQLAGVVKIPRILPPTDAIRSKLSCIRTVSESKGKTREELSWQDERIISEPMRDRFTNTTAIPVLFAIPYECQETSRDDKLRDYSWRLDVSARLPGVDYASRFEVPVFKTELSRPDFQLDAKLAMEYAAPVDRDALFAEEGILKSALGSDGVRLVFPAARNWPTAFGITVFVAIWGIATWLMWHFAAPMFFTVIFFLFWLLPLWMAVELWFYRSVVEADRNQLAVRGGLLGFGRRKTFASGDIIGLSAEQYVSSGVHQWKIISVQVNGGAKHTLAKAIASKLSQEAVIDEMHAALGWEGRDTETRRGGDKEIG